MFRFRNVYGSITRNLDNLRHESNKSFLLLDNTCISYVNRCTSRLIGSWNNEKFLGKATTTTRQERSIEQSHLTIRNWEVKKIKPNDPADYRWKNKNHRGKFDFSVIDSNFVNKIVEIRSGRRVKKVASENTATLRNKSLPWWAIPESSSGPRLNGIYNQNDLSSVKVLSSEKFKEESTPKSQEKRRWRRSFSALWKAKEFFKEELQDRKAKANQIEPVKEKFEYKIQGTAKEFFKEELKDRKAKANQSEPVKEKFEYKIQGTAKNAKKSERQSLKVFNSKGLIDYGHYLKSKPQLVKEKFIGTLTVVIPTKPINKPKIANNSEDSKFYYVPKRLRSRTSEEDCSLKKK